MAEESKTKIRLQKFLAQAGVSSRRAGEKLILGGKVQVNGVVVKELGTKVDPGSDEVHLDGKQIAGKEKYGYYLFHKPKNVVVTRHDPEGRPTVFDYLKKIVERINPVGRLDFDSEGLIFLTNDGDLHYRLTHPSKEVPKRYRVKVAPVGVRSTRPPEGGCTPPLREIIRQLSLGIDIGGYVTAPCQVKYLGEEWLEITLREGKNRQIRRMLEAVGYGALRLIRISIGPLELGHLVPGTYRPLSLAELSAVKAVVRKTSPTGPTHRHPFRRRPAPGVKDEPTCPTKSYIRPPGLFHKRRNPQ